MSVIRVSVFNQIRCGLLSHCAPRVKFPAIACVQKATVWSRRHENDKANRVEMRLQKLLKKKKKEHSFDAISHMQLGQMVKQRSVPAPTKRGREMVAEMSVKLKTYNTLLHQSIDDIISQDLEELQLSILGVRLAGDLSTCRVYWQASENYQENQKIQDVLNSYAAKLRYKLINHRVLGKVPKIAFLQEKSAAKRAEVEKLLELANIPPNDTEEENVDPIKEIPSEELEPVLGLDQTEIKQQIVQMKKLWAKHEDEHYTEYSIDKFTNSIKRRKKGREKALYSIDGDFSSNPEIADVDDDNLTDDE